MDEPQLEVDFYGGPWDGSSSLWSVYDNYYIWVHGIDSGCYVFTIQEGRNTYHWINAENLP